jgi:catechol 2,3-dioxygenase-like lactoylglutathione lyase family enzyme
MNGQLSRGLGVGMVSGREDLAMIRGIKFVSVPVKDQDRALEFFTTKLGFKVSTDQPFDGKQRWIELMIPGAETGLVLFTPEGFSRCRLPAMMCLRLRRG